MFDSLGLGVWVLRFGVRDLGFRVRILRMRPLLVCERVCVRVSKRDSVCERKRECVRERQRDRETRQCVWVREKETVCVCERESGGGLRMRPRLGHVLAEGMARPAR